MKALATPAQQVSAALAVTAVALLGLLAYEADAAWAMRTRLLSMRGVSASPPPQSALPPFGLRPLDGYNSIIDKPLFVASRKPAPVAAAEQPNRYELVGISRTGTNAAVVLKNLETGKAQTLRTGETGDGGMELGTVTDTSADLKQSGGTVTLVLSVAHGTRPARPMPNGPAPQTTPAANAAVRPAPPRAAPPVLTPSQVQGLADLNRQRARQGLPPLE